TSTKNPRYRDVLYVEELVGRDTVNTLPPATLEAFRDHGVPRESLGEGTEEARETLAHLSRCGIDLEEVTGRLLVEGVAQFRDAFDRLKAAIETRVRTLGT
ncbi:MAG: transaldolase, partial [Burkholderiales bacterium]|nr:transaldolase [Burkholderiales bacterium]